MTTRKCLSILPTIILGMISVILAFCPDAYAIKDKGNQERWSKPTTGDAPDREVPGFLVNLGPTGARAVLTERTFIVRHIFKKSPAMGRLREGDVIGGAFGRSFSAHTFGGSPHGYEGPIMDLGLAIEKAEGTDGKLVLNVTRDSKTIDVTIDLKPIGAFSPTFPIHCKKSELIRAQALNFLASHPDAQKGPSHTRMAVTLAFLASDNARYQSIGKSMARRWSAQRPNSETWTWNLSHQLITLSEYYLLSKDSSVLPTIKFVVGLIQKAQYSGRIRKWKPDNHKQDFATIDAAQQLYDGGFGHAPYVGIAGKGGYGPMQYTTILAVTARQLAARCGAPIDQDKLKRSMDFIHRGTNRAGYVAYGGEFTLNNGPVDPVRWKNSTRGDNYVGRVGCAIVAHRLTPEFPTSTKYIGLYGGFCKRAFKSMPDGHGDTNLGILWGLMGAAASEDRAVLRAVFDYHKAFFNMARCHDGSFVVQPGRDYADGGYYRASRYHPTATMALGLGLSYPRLRIQGIEVSIPGINPKALKGKMNAAYKAIVKKAYKKASYALARPKPDDEAPARAMTEYIDSQWRREIAGLEVIEESGDILSLKDAVVKLRHMFTGIEGFDQNIKRYVEGFLKDPWKKEVSLSKAYHSYLNLLKRYKSPSALAKIEKFAKANQDSIYGKWASAVVNEFRDSGTIPVSSSGRPFGAPAQDASTSNDDDT